MTPQPTEVQKLKRLSAPSVDSVMMLSLFGSRNAARRTHYSIYLSLPLPLLYACEPRVSTEGPIAEAPIKVDFLA